MPKPSGSGINPCFLWDNPVYMLGYKPDDSKPERTKECFEAFRQRHLDLESAIDDAEFLAVCRFLESWKPEDAAKYEKLVEVGTGFGVFQIRGRPYYVHQREAVVDWWKSQLSAEGESTPDSPAAQCLITGERAAIARLHEPKIKGVWGAQSAGAAIVSFNLDAFESYGKEQSLNAPVSEKAAFQYCTALNRLLDDRGRRIQVGDATTVFWTDKPSPAENMLGVMLDSGRAEDEQLAKRVQSTLPTIAAGDFPDEIGDRDTQFYVLGLSPNAARISVRFWLVGTLGQLVENLKQHFDDLRIDRSERDPEFISPYQIIRETAREPKDIPPLLGGALMRSILTGQPYPHMLLSSLIRRIRADREVRYVRAAAIKACLNRNIRRGLAGPISQPVGGILDPNRTETAYHLGRLFARLEKTQDDAMPGIHGAVRKRYFAAASTHPAMIFPQLLRMFRHHLKKLKAPPKWSGEDATEKFQRYHEECVWDITDAITHYRQFLSIPEQGLFALGYHLQRQFIFTKKETADISRAEI